MGRIFPDNPDQNGIDLDARGREPATEVVGVTESPPHRRFVEDLRGRGRIHLPLDPGQNGGVRRSLRLRLGARLGSLHNDRRGRSIGLLDHGRCRRDRWLAHRDNRQRDHRGQDHRGGDQRETPRTRGPRLHRRDRNGRTRILDRLANDRIDVDRSRIDNVEIGRLKDFP